MNTIVPIAWVGWFYIIYLIGDWVLTYLNEFMLSLFVGMGLVLLIAILYVLAETYIRESNERKLDETH